MKSLSIFLCLTIFFSSCQRRISISEFFYMGMTSDEFYKNVQQCDYNNKVCIQIPTIRNSNLAEAAPNFVNGKLVELKLVTKNQIDKEELENTLNYLISKFGQPTSHKNTPGFNNIICWELKSGLQIYFYGLENWWLTIEYKTEYDFQKQFEVPEKPKPHI